MKETHIKASQEPDWEGAGDFPLTPSNILGNCQCVSPKEAHLVEDHSLRMFSMDQRGKGAPNASWGTDKLVP